MTRYYLFICLFVLSFSCKKEPIVSSSTGNSSNWLVPQAELEFGTNKDAIRAVDNPLFVPKEEILYMEAEDIVQVLKLEDEIRAYPINVLDWHEIVNDQINDKKVAITYCPLTGTGICWNREIDGMQTTFGVSGWLYRSNLIAFDRATDSYWSQMRMDCINGNFTGRLLSYYHMVEMSWAAFKEMLPEVKVLSADTGFGLPYTDYPYYDYPTNNSFFVVPIEFEDERLSAKERVLGVNVLGQVRVYPYNLFDSGEVNVINDVFKGQPVVVVGHPDKNFITAYKANFEGSTLNFRPVQEGGAVVMQDDQGNRWNILGQAVEGPDEGKSLKTIKAFTGYWFAWLEFYPQAEIYE